MIATKGKAKQGAPVPLFDRLVDLDPKAASEAHPHRTLDRDGLNASVRVEVERLLNTRASLTQEELEGRERTVIDYGIPDFGTFHTSSRQERYLLSHILARTIEAYEPRLRRVRVEMEDLAPSENSLIARVSADIVAGDIVEPVSFPVVIRSDAEREAEAPPEDADDDAAGDEGGDDAG